MVDAGLLGYLETCRPTALMRWGWAAGREMIDGMVAFAVRQERVSYRARGGVPMWSLGRDGTDRASRRASRAAGVVLAPSRELPALPVPRHLRSATSPCRYLREGWNIQSIAAYALVLSLIAVYRPWQRVVKWEDENGDYTGAGLVSPAGGGVLWRGGRSWGGRGVRDVGAGVFLCMETRRVFLGARRAVARCDLACDDVGERVDRFVRGR